MTVVCLGEILLRLSMPGVARFQQALPGTIHGRFTGAEANVAAGIASLGQECRYVTALPQNEIADVCLNDLRSCRIDISCVVRTDGGRLGTFYLEHGVNQRAGNIVYDRDHSSVSITSTDDYDWDAIFNHATWFFVSGITAAISQQGRDLVAKSVSEAKRRGLSVAFDINHRNSLWKWDRQLSSEQLACREYSSLVQHCDVLLCGQNDAIRFFDVPPESSTQEMAGLLAAKFPELKMIAGSVRQNSDGRRSYSGFLHHCESSMLFQARRYPIETIVDRLGIGDAFAAGIIFAFNNAPDAYQNAIDFAAAMGCLAHTIEGDFPLVTSDDVTTLIADVDSAGRINR